MARRIRLFLVPPVHAGEMGLRRLDHRDVVRHLPVRRVDRTQHRLGLFVLLILVFVIGGIAAAVNDW